VWVDYADFPKMDTAELWDGEEAKLEVHYLLFFLLLRILGGRYLFLLHALLFCRRRNSLWMTSWVRIKMKSKPITIILMVRC
jgi:hypothetical protein